MNNKIEHLIERFFHMEENVLDHQDLQHIIIEQLVNKKPVVENTKLDALILNEFIKHDKNLSSRITKIIDSLDKESLNIISVTPSNKSDKAIVVRFEDKEDINKGRTKIKRALKNKGMNLQDELINKFDPSIEITKAADQSEDVYIVYKYDIGSREGLALEHLMAFVLTGAITDQLKNRLNLSPEASREEVLKTIKEDFSDILPIAIKGKKLILEQIGEIINAESVGSENSKADLILTSADGKKHGLSIKLVKEEGREVRFTYNKNLGYGDEQEDNLVNSPSGKPWWLIGRQIFAKKLGRKYNPSIDDLEAPSWMTKAKESNKDIYKEAMEDVYAQMREVFVNKLRSKSLKELADIVSEAQLGSNDEQEIYENLFVLVSDTDGIRLEKKDASGPDILAIKTSGIDKTDIVQTDGARIMIAIPGMDELTIHGLKFHSNMLSSNREDLKIKTR